MIYFLDNCWKENKNRFLLSFLSSLVQLNIFKEATVSFLIVGHTGKKHVSPIFFKFSSFKDVRPISVSAFWQQISRLKTLTHWNN